MNLVLENVTKKYKDKTAIQNVSATLHSGQLIGLIGKNGAGKTTLLKLLSTIMKPTNGRILLDGEDIVKKPNIMRKLIGYLPQEVFTYPNLTVLEYLSYIASVKGLKKKEAEHQIHSLLSEFHLEHAGNKRLGNCSGGMKQRVGIICALLGNPQIIIADEPTTGLDPQERIAVRKNSFPKQKGAYGNIRYPLCRIIGKVSATWYRQKRVYTYGRSAGKNRKPGLFV